MRSRNKSLEYRKVLCSESDELPGFGKVFLDNIIGKYT